MNEEEARGDGKVDEEMSEEEVTSVEGVEEGDELPEVGREEMFDSRDLNLSVCVKESMR